METTRTSVGDVKRIASEKQHIEQRKNAACVKSENWTSGASWDFGDNVAETRGKVLGGARGWTRGKPSMLGPAGNAMEGEQVHQTGRRLLVPRTYGRC